MYRAIYFLAIISIPTIFSWWLFIPMALLYVYLAKLPYEMIVAGAMLDIAYYFGDGFFISHSLAIFSFILILIALFLNERIHWRNVI